MSSFFKGFTAIDIYKNRPKMFFYRRLRVITILLRGVGSNISVSKSDSDDSDDVSPKSETPSDSEEISVSIIYFMILFFRSISFKYLRMIFLAFGSIFIKYQILGRFVLVVLW